MKKSKQGKLKHAPPVQAQDLQWWRMRYRSKGKGEHYRLIVAAMRAKLEQNPKVREMLLATGSLVLLPDHVQEADPPAEWKYCKIWMELRAGLQRATSSSAGR